MNSRTTLLITFFLLLCTCPQLLFSQFKVKGLLEKEKYEKAMEYCSKLEGEEQKLCFTLMGNHYLDLDDYEEAGKCYLLAGDLNLVEISARSLLGLKEYDKAANLFEMAYTEDREKLNEKYLEIAAIGYSKGDFNYAMDYYEKALAEDKDNLKEKYIKVGKGYCDIEEYSKAADLYIKYEYKEGLEYIGDVLFGKRNFELAKTYYIKSQDLFKAANSGGTIKSLYYYGLWIDDRTGQGYKTVTIGPQVWMAENLNNRTYNDGSSIIRCDDDWMERTGAYCWYYFDSARYDNPYGRLYNWYAVNTGKLCPAGWHVPSTDEWQALETYLLENQAIGDDGVVAVTAGGLLKESGDEHWKDSNEGATNTSGFTALPGGKIYTGVKIAHIITDRSSKDIGKSAYFHSSTEADNNEQYGYHQSYCFKLSSKSTSSKLIEINQGDGAHVRCIKDY